MDYSNVLSRSVTSLQPSGIRKFFELLEQLPDAISLSIGEPDFQTPWHIRDAGVYSLEKGWTKYSANAGFLSLRKELSEYLKRRFDLGYDPAAEILVTVGGSEAIDLGIRALVNPGDEVIIVSPSFVCYEPLTIMAGGVPVRVVTKAENEFRLTGAELRAVLTPKTKLLILPYPCNPTGAVMRRIDLAEIEATLRGTDVMILSDEIYAELTYGTERHTSPANIPGLKERTIVVNGFSKCYSMTGWRLGYACAHKDIISQMTKLHQFAVMCAPTASQYAAIEALKEGDSDIARMRASYDKRRIRLRDGLHALGIDCFDAKGAFYLFPYIGKFGLTSDEFCERFLMEEGVAIISGTAFGAGGEGFARMCYAASEADISEALARLGRFTSRLAAEL
ncbi:MAG: aminotransferase class I/II-fold pyridoxal phosphate-dependent enzyme [Oscillospiraceae bacterium]|jgi:aminotransferase|nr:aminotransferase class I/II-fold pyridoxal phosphate-dependent enzyme [Oscillospiraceae bacterium]